MVLIVGKAFASLGDDASLKEALFNSGKELNGRKVLVSKASKITEKENVNTERRP